MLEILKPETWPGSRLHLKRRRDWAFGHLLKPEVRAFAESCGRSARSSPRQLGGLREPAKEVEDVAAAETCIRVHQAGGSLLYLSVEEMEADGWEID